MKNNKRKKRIKSLKIKIKSFRLTQEKKKKKNPVPKKLNEKKQKRFLQVK